jgi:hypothetical protein
MGLLDSVARAMTPLASRFITAAAANDSVRDLLSALQGISTFSPNSFPGPELGDDSTHEVRRAMGGALETIPQVRLRWYPPDIERAQRQAAGGDMTMIGQLNESMKLDGVWRGLMDARTSVVSFPKRFYGSDEVVKVLQSKTNSDRNVYDEMIPRTEARLMVADEINCGVAVGEMVPVRGRDFPVLVRRFPQNLFYMWNRNQWFYRSIVGMMPITPGVPDKDGNCWVLHIGGGRLAPWNNGLWNTGGRSYINKTQTLFARQSYVMKHAHPARVATAPIGAAEEERRGMLRSLIRWAMNGAFSLPPGWDIKLIESKGEGIKVYDDEIRTYNEEMATALCGSAVMLQGTAGFSNMDVFRVVQTDLIKTSADAWDHTENTQIFPAFIAGRWGTEAIRNATTVETDVAAPRDRKVEADTMVSLSNAITGLVNAIAAAQKAAGVKHAVALNVNELLARFGLPVVDAPPAETTPTVSLTLAPTDVAKVVRVDEARTSQGLAPIGDDRGTLTISELDALSKAPAPAAAPSEAA